VSSAGTLGGIRASRSGLFFEMLRVARHSGARTLVGENVPNLLTIHQGKDFRKLTLEEAVAIALTQIE
jgi:site-specific DNA-cytosine methylase